MGDQQDTTTIHTSADLWVFVAVVLMITIAIFVAWFIGMHKRGRDWTSSLLHQSLLRRDLDDSFVETGEAEWQCILCCNYNHPQRKNCCMCGTGKREFILESSPRDESTVISSDALCDTSSKSIEMTKRQRAFYYKAINTANLTLRQRGAQRRHIWKRVADKDQGMKWVRADMPTAKLTKLNTTKLRTENPSNVLEPGCDSTSHRNYRESFPVSPEVDKSPGFIAQFGDRGHKWLSVDEACLEIIDDDQLRDLDLEDVYDLEGIAAMPFKKKHKWFLVKLDTLAVPSTTSCTKVVVRRDHIISDSMNQILYLPHDILQEHLYIVFSDEPALDAGGVLREWYSLIFNALFDESFGLFQLTHAENRSYWIHANANSIHKDFLELYRFTGRCLGKGILDGLNIGVYLALPLLKHILGVPISFSDLQFLDEELYKYYSWLRKSKEGISELYLTFSVNEIDGSGNVQTIDLKPNGRNLDVTNENKEEYLNLLLRHKMLESISAPLKQFILGIYEVVPKHLLSIFDYQELELLLCGLPDIDVADWKSHTLIKYIGDRETSDQQRLLSWFWQTIESFSVEERARLLQFVTGSSRVPAQGFKALVAGSGVVQWFTIQLIPISSHPTAIFPRSHTCYNRLDVPLYASLKDMKRNLSLVIQMEVTGFTMI